MYTYRIMDIIASIGNCLVSHFFNLLLAKQNKDIAKITADIRDVQKTINMYVFYSHSPFPFLGI